MTVNGATPNWLNPVPSGDVGHGQLPGDPLQWNVLSEDQLQQMRKQLLESVIASVVQAVQGLFIPGPFGSALNQLSEWANGLPTFQQVIQGTVTAIAEILHYPDPENATVLQLIDWVFDKFLGLVLPHRLPILPISHLTNAPVNLLTNPMFTGSPFLPEEAGEWVLDEAVSQNGIGGSALITADGTQKSLLTVDLIPVTVGQQLEVSAWIKTEGINAGLDSIVFGIAEYQTLDGSDTPTYRVLARASASGTTDWKKWAGTYNAGLNAVAVRMFVEVRATAKTGKVWFDNLFAGKKGLLEIEWVSGLSQEITNVWQSISNALGLDEWQEFLDNAFANTQNEIAQNLLEAQQNWQEFTEQLSNFLQLDKWDEWLSGDWSDIQKVLEDVWEAIEETLQNFANFLGLDKWDEWLTGDWAQVQADIAQNWQDFTEQLATFLQLDKWQEFLEGAWADLLGGVDDVWEAIEQALLNFANFLGLDKWQDFLDQVTGQANANVQQLQQMLQHFTQTGQFPVEELIGMLFPEQIAFPGFENLGEAWQNIQSQITDNLLEAQQNWQDFTEQLANFLQLDKWDEWLEGAWADLLGGIDDVWEAIEQTLLNFGNFLGLEDFQTFLDGLTQQIATGAQNSITNFIHIITGNNQATAATLQAMLQNLTANGLFSAAHLTGMVPFGQVSGVGGFANIGDAVQDGISNLQSTWDQWMAALTGIQNSTGSPELTAEQISELMANVVANATAIAQINSQTQANNSGGMSGGDDFERPANTSGVGPGWGTSTPDASGSKFTLDGHEAVWGEKGKVNEVRHWRTDPKDAKTKTAFQSITRVNGTKLMQVALLPDLSGQKPSGVDTILGRVSDDGTKYLIALIDGDDVKLRYNLGAGERDFNPPATARIGRPAVGTRLTLECGDADGSVDALHTYKVLRNGAPILVYTDTNDVTAPLDDNRGWGWGGKSGIALLGELSPSSVNAVTVADNPPTPTVGTYLRVYRKDASGVKHPDGEAPLPANCMNFVQRTSIDLGWDQPTQTLVVTKPGPYNINSRLEFATTIVGVDRWDLLLYVKGVKDSNFTVVARSGQAAGAAGSNADAVAGAFSYYFEAGDQVRLGIGTKGNGIAPDIEIVGDAAGTQTWMTVTRGA